MDNNESNTFKGLFTSDIEQLSKMTYEEAEAKHKQWEQAGKAGPSPMGQWAVWHNLLPLCEKKWKDGDSRGLFEGLHFCGESNIPLPNWCSLAITKAFFKMDSYEIRTWDEVFSVPLKGRKLPDLRRQKYIKGPSIHHMLEKVEQGQGIEDAAMETAAFYHISDRCLIDWYYEHLKQYPITRILTNHGWEEAPTNPHERKKSDKT